MLRAFSVFTIIGCLSLPIVAFADFDAPPATPVVNVADQCTAADISNVPHSYTSGQFLGICALVAAKEQGAVTSYGLLYDDSFGFYVQTLGGISPSSTQYWALYLNSGYSNDGLSTMVVAQGDLLTFQLTDWTDNSTVGSPVEFEIGSLISTPAPAPSTSTGGMTMHDPFSVPRAVVYLWDRQRPDGSFDSELLNDWIAIASGSGSLGDIRKKLAEFERSHQPALSSVTDYERHAMALQALGINPYNGTPVDYIAPILAAFDGTQIGDPSLVNDDIFAVFPLLHAGYTRGDNVIQKIAVFIIANQKQDGSWNSSIDMTAAGIQALTLTPDVPGASETLTRAEGYLRSAQTDDGGFGNSQSTSWALQALWARQQTMYDWVRNVYFTPDYFLATKQDVDGGVEPTSVNTQTRMWATAYALPSIERKTWDDLLSHFEKPVPPPASVATSTETVIESVREASSPIVSTAQMTVPQPSEKFAAQEEPVVHTAASSSVVSTSSLLTASAASAGLTIDWKTALWVLALIFAIGLNFRNIQNFRKRRR